MVVRAPSSAYHVRRVSQSSVIKSRQHIPLSVRVSGIGWEGGLGRLAWTCGSSCLKGFSLHIKRDDEEGPVPRNPNSPCGQSGCQVV